APPLPGGRGQVAAHPGRGRGEAPDSPPGPDVVKRLAFRRGRPAVPRGPLPPGPFCRRGPAADPREDWSGTDALCFALGSPCQRPGGPGAHRSGVARGPPPQAPPRHLDRLVARVRGGLADLTDFRRARASLASLPLPAAEFAVALARLDNARDDLLEDEP